MRSRELLAHAVGLGDVGHRRHPPGLLAVGVNQGRDIQAGIEQRAVFALHAHLESAGHAAAAQLVAQLGVQGFMVFLGPVGVGGLQAHQFGFAPASHLAQRRVHVGDASFHVQRAHPGQDGVFHGATEVGLSHQGLLRLHAPASVAPGGNQHPGRHGAQCAHQPEQATAYHAKRGAVSLRTQHQPIANGGHRHFVFVGLGRPGQQLGGRVARGQGGTCQHLVTGIHQRNGIARQHFGRSAIAQQAVDGVLAQHDACELTLVVQRHLQLQQGRRIPLRGSWLGVNRLLQVTGQAVGVCGLSRLEQLARHPQLLAGQRGRRMAGANLSALINPGDGLQFGVLADEGLGPVHKFRTLQLLVGDVAGNAHQLFLAFQQAQANPLLRIFHVTAKGFLLALGLLRAQIPERGHDGGQKHHHSSQGCQGGKPVLARGRKAAPPLAPPACGRGNGRWLGGCCGLWACRFHG